jgi:nicotinamide-nucleotide amidase
LAFDVELLMTGDELTRGAVTDTNSGWLAQRALACGARIRRVTAVGDIAEDICAALKEAAERSPVVVVSGGLGPTSDDLTAACAAKVGNVPLVRDEDTLERIRGRWARRGKPMPPAVEKQALVPQGAEVLANDEGTAPGFRQRIGRADCFFFAGVPRELKHLADRHLFPWLQARTSSVLVTRTLRCVGIPESEVDAALLPLVQGTQVVFGLRATFPETWATFTLEAPTSAAAEVILAPLVQAAVERLHPHVYTTEDLPLAQVVGQLCVRAGWTIAVAESCTGGLLGGELTAIDGSSRYFVGGGITYANEEKTRALGVPPELIREHGAVSEPVVRAMAEGARDRLHTHAALAITGVAGPGGGTPEKPVGTVWIALAEPRGTIAELKRFTRTDRESVRSAAVSAALDLLRCVLLERVL